MKLIRHVYVCAAPAGGACVGHIIIGNQHPFVAYYGDQLAKYRGKISAAHLNQ